jgi:hypothetical protein
VVATGVTGTGVVAAGATLADGVAVVVVAALTGDVGALDVMVADRATAASVLLIALAPQAAVSRTPAAITP